MRTLIIIRGIPGSGKSTFVKDFLNTFDHFEADMFHYDDEGNYNFSLDNIKKGHEWCYNKVENSMKNDKSVVVSNTFTTEKEIHPYLILAEKYNYRIISLITENRHGNKSIHNVPDNTLDKMINRFTLKLK